ncbi:hypothetical protein LSTR_LSTR013864 [Laodelphax striatellus]|uniref:RNA-binding protein NOB1 n=1 Tax=Laodelphax striatellus TaxID=195883 RepID=A0A482WMC0_LAOST|nr:hypothetical protein LSTR_LSTR013864 [Laodelphax striatellus]
MQISNQPTNLLIFCFHFQRKSKTSTSESVNTDEKEDNDDDDDDDDEEEEEDAAQNEIADILAEQCTLKAGEESEDKGEGEKGNKVGDECKKEVDDGEKGEGKEGECNKKEIEEEEEEKEEDENEDDGLEIKIDENSDENSILVKVNEEQGEGEESDYDSDDGYDEDDDDDADWITVDNIKEMKQVMEWDNVEEKAVDVACLTTDFAMQIGLNVASLDGKLIKQLRTFILRCYACFKTTSVMTKLFCPHCGNKTLKKVAVSLDSDGNQKIHINLRKPLTARGKKFSLPKPQGGKHANYPVLCEDQPMPDQRPTRLARMRNNPLEPDYIAGFSPFVMRDVNSKSAMLGIPGQGKQVKYWMRRNPNEAIRRSKKKK